MTEENKTKEVVCCSSCGQDGGSFIQISGHWFCSYCIACAKQILKVLNPRLRVEDLNKVYFPAGEDLPPPYLPTVGKK